MLRIPWSMICTAESRGKYWSLKNAKTFVIHYPHKGKQKRKVEVKVGYCFSQFLTFTMEDGRRKSEVQKNLRLDICFPDFQVPQWRWNSEGGKWVTIFHGLSCSWFLTLKGRRQKLEERKIEGRIELKYSPSNLCFLILNSEGRRRKAKV